MFVLTVFVRAHLTFFAPLWPMNGKDEGYITAFAVRLRDGHWLPYVDAVSHRGPVLYWVAALAVSLMRTPSFLPIRMLALACSLLTVLLVFAVAVQARRPLSGAVAVLTIAVVLIVDQPPDDGLAYNGEPLLNVFVWAGFICLLKGLGTTGSTREAPKLGWLTASGALCMLGVLSRQVGAVILPPFALWIGIASIARRTPSDRFRRWMPLGAFIAGATAPALAVVLRYAAAGELRTFFFYFVTYNSRYYMAPFSWESGLHTLRSWLVARATLIAIAALLVVTAIVRAMHGLREGARWRTLDRHGLLWVVALCAALTGLVSNATLRDWPHYYVQAVPWFALLLGLLLEQVAVTRGSPDKRAILVASVLLPMWFVTSLMFDAKISDLAVAERSRPPTLPVCKYVDAHSEKSDAIYVWGFAPDLYTFCARRPASRYVFSTFQSGYIPFFDEATPRQDEARIVPGSERLFLDDLEASRPELVLDVPWTMGKRSIRDRPAYRNYVDEHYCTPVRVDGVDVYARRHRDRACPGRE